VLPQRVGKERESSRGNFFSLVQDGPGIDRGTTLVYAHTIALKRTALHFDPADMKILARLAHAETRRTGTRVTAAAIVRRIVKAYLHEQRGED
jgi:hypothetical protein